MLSIPRDTWVPIAGTSGSNKINAAFNNGPNQLVKTIQDNFHIPINHVMMANFCGFQGMVNALGGISLDFKYPVRDQYSGLNIRTTGCQLLNGAQALALVRSRHLYYYKDKVWSYDGDSDWSRIRRQQAFFHALLNKVHGAFPDVFTLNSFLGATVSDLTIDSSLGGGELISLGLKYHSLSEASLVTTVLPTYSETIDNQSALLAAEPSANRTIARFLSLGLPTTSTKPKTSSKTSSSTTTTTPPSLVVTDTPQSLPEPWNPVPC
jgi:LCP family protein required for cell wall assembly